MLSKEKATPSKSDRSESSVLLSLKELRRLEDERVKAEAEARRAQADAERRTKAEAEQRTRDEETRRVREEEERRRRAESERDARQREDRLRLEEAERRARVEGELRLREQQRLDKHRQRQHLGRSAWMAAAAAVTLFLAAGGGVAAWTSGKHQAEKKALEQEIARQGEQARAAQLAIEAKIRALEEKARLYLGEARTAKEQARIIGDLQRQKQAIETTRPRPPRRIAPPRQAPAAAAPPSPFRVPRKPQIDDDPVGGLPGINSVGF
jgi:hypothetical protein